MHSENFEKVRGYYIHRLWNLTRLRNAVGKWITEEEFKEIAGKDFK